MARFNPRAQERMDRFAAGQHVTSVLRLRAPRRLLDAVKSGDAQRIATVIARLDADGFDLGAVVKGRLRALKSARGATEIAFALQRLAEIARAFLNCEADDDEERSAAQ